MGHSKEELEQKFALAEKIQMLKKIQVETDYRAQAAQAILSAKTSIVPGLDAFLKAGDSVAKVGEKAPNLHPASGSESIAHGFHFGAVAIAGIDFLRIPMIYLAAYLLKQEVPINLNNNARWLYSGLLLGLTITALAVPVAAPVIAFVGAGLGLVSGLYLLGSALKERNQLRKDLKRTDTEIHRAEDQMMAIQDEAKYLEQHLAKAQKEQEIIDLSLEIVLLDEQYRAQQKELTALHDKRVQLAEKLKVYDHSNFLNRGLGISFATLTIIGLIVSLVVPPVGLGILVGVAAASATYLLGRLALPFVKTFANWVKEKWTPTPQPKDQADDEGSEALSESEREVKADTDDVHMHRERLLTNGHEPSSASSVLLGLAETEHLAPSPSVNDKPDVAPKADAHLFAPAKKQALVHKIVDEQIVQEKEGEEEGEGEGPVIH